MDDNTQPDPEVVDSILSNVGGDAVSRETNLSHDRKLVGGRARRSIQSEDGIDWEAVEESDTLTALGNDGGE